MFFLNLTTGEFLALVGGLGGLITALYLLDRAKRRKTVSTLRFWVAGGAAEQRRARRRMNDPWSLILQLISLLLLLLAVARLQWGDRARSAPDYAVLVDISSWSGLPGMMERERAQARSYLRDLPPNARVMLIAADSLPKPLTPFTEDREVTLKALSDLAPGYSSLNMDANLAFARQAQKWSGAARSEIVYVGPQLAEVGEASGDHYDDVRILHVPADRENCGIRQLTVERDDSEANSWQAFVRLKNYGAQLRQVRLEMHYGPTAFAPRHLTLASGAEATAEYRFTTRTAGELTASITPGGSLSSDDRASVFLPASEALRIVVYTDRAPALKPLFPSTGHLHPSFYPAAQYVPNPRGDLIVLDRVGALATPVLPSLWIDPPKGQSPLAVKSEVKDVPITWRVNSPLESALQGKQVRLPSAKVFEIFQGDSAVASVPTGPVVVVRAADGGRPPSAIVGFDPLGGEMRFEVASPLLIADLLEWLQPAAFRSVDFAAERVGLLSLPLDGRERAAPIHVTDEHANAIPFTQRATEHGGALQLFVSRPATVKVTSVERERTVNFGLPAVAESLWVPPLGAAVGLPAKSSFAPPAADLWRWLALAGALGLLLEWLLFANKGRIAARQEKGTAARNSKAASIPEEELVSR